MRLALAAVGAVVTALLQLTLVPYLQVGGAQPDLILVFAVTMTVAGDLESGLVWAFVGGLMIDVLAPRPLGMTAFALLISVGIASLLGRVLGRLRYLAPPIAVFVLSFVNSLLILLAFNVLGEPIQIAEPIRTFLPDAIYSAAVAAAVGVVAVNLRLRAEERERVAW